MKVGLIGLGAMGSNMARNIAGAGLLKSVWNRTRAKAEIFAHEMGVEIAASPAALAAGVDVVLTCVAADQDVIEMIESILQGINPGSIVVDMSTVSSNTAEQAARLLNPKQVDFLDAPVSGGVEGAKNGTLAIMVGGNAAALEKARPILEILSSRIIHMGETGSGQGAKAVNQVMAAGINQAVTEAMSFARAQGLPMDKLIDVISGGAAGNWFLEHRGTTMTHGSFEPGFKLALHHKDLKICQAMADSTGLSTPLLDQTVADYEELMRQGYGEEDISALYRLKSKN